MIINEYEIRDATNRFLSRENSLRRYSWLHPSRPLEAYVTPDKFSVGELVEVLTLSRDWESRPTKISPISHDEGHVPIRYPQINIENLTLSEILKSIRETRRHFMELERKARGAQ